jgi:hypothetical protein
MISPKFGPKVISGYTKNALWAKSLSKSKQTLFVKNIKFKLNIKD